jgi:2-methylcitrate dehydratase PrpD
MSTAAQRLAGFTSALTLDAIPPAVVEAAKLHLLDTLGTGLAAHALDVAAYATAAACEGGTQGPASVIGLAGGAPSADAALANGTLCHALDFDDTHSGAVAHISVAVAPAALAVAEEQGATGAELLGAYVAGSETAIRIGMAAGAAFHARGFHPTAVCGVFGATAAAARLRGLDAPTTTQALGIAGSMASGLLEFLADGSATKRLHPGWAAHAGVMAARLAAHGATGPASVFEGRFGLYRAYIGRDDIDVDAQLADLGERWETPRIAFKPFPACHFMHASLDATRQLMDEEPIDPGAIEEIVALSTAAGVDLVLEPLTPKLRPRSEYEAKFSLPYSVGAMLIRGHVDLTSYTDAAIAEEAVLAVAARVRYEIKDYPTFPGAFPGGIRIRLRDGRVREAELDYQRGGPENPMTPAEVVEKFRATAGLALAADAVRDLEAAILALDEHADAAALHVLRTAGGPAVAA